MGWKFPAKHQYFHDSCFFKSITKYCPNQTVSYIRLTTSFIETDIESVVAFLGRDVSELEAEGPITRDKALIKLRKLQKNKDIESAHCDADHVLCDLLETLGFKDVVQEYHKVKKWYS